MSHTTITNYDQLPLVLNADTLASVLGISRSGAYNLLHRADFPTLSVGGRLLVSKENLFQWISKQTAL